MQGPPEHNCTQSELCIGQGNHDTVSSKDEQKISVQMWGYEVRVIPISDFRVVTPHFFPRSLFAGH